MPPRKKPVPNSVVSTTTADIIESIQKNGSANGITQDNMSSTCAHYDAVSKQSGESKPVRQALKDRAEGPSYLLKDFHNKIKLKMITSFCSRGFTVLDLCCGRGGDILKWAKARASYVKGIDISSGAISNARQRHHDLRQQVQETRFDYIESDCLGKTVATLSDDGQRYDLISCFFALHYFFKDEDCVHKIFATVSNNLKVGGLFVGTCANGKSILKLLDRRETYQNTAITVQKKWEGDYTAMGSAYMISIADTVTESSTSGTENTEFLVFESVLKEIARVYKLSPVNWSRYPSFDGHAHPATNGVFRNFNPTANENIPSTHPDLQAVSKLFSLFAFVKLDS